MCHYPALAGMHVLLVEDSPANQLLAQELMQGWGVRCTVAPHGAAALAQLDGGAAFHLVLTDLQMPVMDGFELAERLRADARYARLPLVALSADAGVAERERCTALGMQAFLAKPLEPPQLLAMLQRFAPSAT